MAGTKLGGAKAAAINKKIYGQDFYKKIGAIGGKNGTTGGFASNKIGADGLTGRERARIAGEVGGHLSTRAKVRPQRNEVWHQKQMAKLAYQRKVDKAIKELEKHQRRHRLKLRQIAQ